MAFLDGTKEMSLNNDTASELRLSSLVDINNKEELEAYLKKNELFDNTLCEVTLKEGYVHNVYLSEIVGNIMYVRYPADVETEFPIDELQEIKII